MKFINRYKKGEYEYASYNKKKTWIITAILYLLSAAIYITGYVTTGSNKNLLTIVAILGILPASKALIVAIMNMRVRILPLDLKKEIDDSIGGLKGYYHLYLTSYEFNYYLAHLVVTKDSLICYTDDKKFDFKQFDAHMEKHMGIEGIEGIVIKVFTNHESYVSRLRQLNATHQADQTNEKLCKLLTNISL